MAETTRGTQENSEGAEGNNEKGGEEVVMLSPEETVLVGEWVESTGRVVEDSTCLRIEAFIESHLRKVAVDSSGWEALHIDPDDARLWEHTYPQGEMHGGGPPPLRVIDADTARVKYGHVRGSAKS